MASRRSGLAIRESGSCRRPRARPMETGARKCGIDSRMRSGAIAGLDPAIHQLKILTSEMDARVPATQKASPGVPISGRRSFSEAGKPAHDGPVLRRVVRLLAVQRPLESIEIPLARPRPIEHAAAADIAFCLLDHRLGKLLQALPGPHGVD